MSPKKIKLSPEEINNHWIERRLVEAEERAFNYPYVDATDNIDQINHLFDWAYSCKSVRFKKRFDAFIDEM